jgi:O-antigen/teichoic acid export membrane protein
MMSTADYAVFSAIMALYAVFSAPLATLLMVVSRRVSELRIRNAMGSAKKFYRRSLAFTTIVGTAAALTCFVFEPALRSYLRSSDAGAVYFFGLLLLASFLPLLHDGFLQGLQRFGWLSASSAIRVLLRIVVSVALILAGFGVSGAILGTLAASILGALVAYYPLRACMRMEGSLPAAEERLAIGPMVPVLIANTAFAAMTQLDMVLVNRYFPPHEAGLYAAASVLGKAVMYLPSGIAMALFPMVSENHARAQSSANLFVQAVLMTLALCGLCALMYFLLGDWIIAIFYGRDYEGAGEILRYYGFAIMPMALVLVAEYFLIAKGQVLFAYLFVLVAPVQVLAIHFWHGSLLTVMAIVAASGASLALVGYALLWRSTRAPAPGGPA